MKRLLFLAIIASVTLFAACGDDKDEDVAGTPPDEGQIDPPAPPVLKPTVTFTLSTGDADVKPNDNVTVTVNTTNFAATQVKLLVNNVEKGTLTTAPYNFQLSGLTLGSYVLKAVAINGTDTINSEIGLPVIDLTQESPTFVSFEGSVPSLWQATSWSIGSEHQAGERALQSTTTDAVVSTVRTGTDATNSVEFYVKGFGKLEFTIDGPSTDGSPSTRRIELTSNWTKYDVYFDAGKHNFSWKVKEGSNVSLDAVKFKRDKLAIGFFYKGGVVAYLANNRKSGFVSADEDQTRTATWSYERLKPTKATSSEIGQGLANTTTLVTLIDALDNSSNKQFGYAAKVSADLVLNGYDDWALPSIKELAQLFKVREEVGGFNLDGKYWSSSVSTAGYTYRYFFDVDSPNPQYYDLNQESPSGVRSIRNISTSVAW